MSAPPQLPPPKAQPRFRIQEAILILRQGKTHSLWREAAWHLMEHAGKDTQLLLEAQRDLLLAAQPAPSFWEKYGTIMVFSALAVASLGLAIWVFIEKLYCA
ncbi:hypothetical protein QNI23_002625 [Bermanella sp. WJH001]|uniref:hypothetical protein n=1 Tax=Bermanella sp. WJH001 TaxID=3048005 RepID=UPI0024BE66DE|nr:hypothetical protein [Bermanella sp. WJH001]MDJ1538347.1 hypothetical protein [Bermanella sp. WJH001]